jgi:hypothetical protein
VGRKKRAITTLDHIYKMLVLAYISFINVAGTETYHMPTIKTLTKISSESVQAFTERCADVARENEAYIWSQQHTLCPTCAPFTPDTTEEWEVVEGGFTCDNCGKSTASYYGW